MQLVVHGITTVSPTARQKTPAIFHRIFGILSGISKHLPNY